MSTFSVIEMMKKMVIETMLANMRPFATEKVILEKMLKDA